MIQPSPRGREHGLAAVVLLLMLNVMFFPYIWGDMNLMSGAHDDPSVTALGGPNGDPNEPVRQSRWKMLDANGSGLIAEPTFPLVHRQVFRDGDVPLWNPDAAFGTPLAAAMQQQAFSPLTAIVVAAPGPTTFALYIIARLFVAGFATYLFMRFSIGFIPALGAGIAFMLNGYFIKYLSMPHLSVETLTPLLFFGVELVLRRRRVWLTVPFLAIVVWCDFLGGMPESSFVNIAFATAYAAFRIWTVDAYRRSWWIAARELAFALACGFACASFLLLPFAELVTHSFNIHEPAKNGGFFPGLGYDTSPRTSLAIYALPLLFGPPWEAAGVPLSDGYFGVAIIYLAFAAVAYGLLVRKSGSVPTLGFFAVATILLTAKRYGQPWIGWVGALPIVRVITLTKYQEVATAFAVAALVGFGLHAILQSERRRPAIAAAAFVVTLATLQKVYDVTPGLTSPVEPHRSFFFYYALGVGLVALAAIAAIAGLAARRMMRKRAAYGVAALAVLTIEMAANYFVPMYYRVDPGPSKRQNPYLGAAYIDFIHRENADASRVYAEHTAWLQPDWSQAFDLADIRDIDAIYEERYLPFVRAFVPNAYRAELAEDFGAAGDFTLATPAGQRLLALGSVRYIVAGQIADPTSLGARIARDTASRLTGVPLERLGQFEIDNEWLDGFGQVGARQDATESLDVSPERPYLSFAVGLQDGFWNVPSRTATFFLRLRDARGRLTTVFDRRVNAASHLVGWDRHTIDLRSYVGTRVNLTFAVRTNDPTSRTTGYWGSVRESRGRDDPNAFAIAYHDPGINVYRFARPLPHGALFDNVTPAADAATLDTLTRPGFDVTRSAVIARESVPPSLTGAVGALARQPVAPARRARLRTYTATDVAYDVDGTKPALLFLSDTFYPGWHAYVDGRETTILRADFLFRGVVVPAGRHRAEFRYEPLTFRLGLVICVAALVALGVFSATTRRATCDLRRYPVTEG